MDNNELVSIVVLAYNGEKVVGDCLNSVFNQIHCNIEVIVVDNASTDGTNEVILQYGENSSLEEKRSLKIKLISNPKNIGFAGHNTGIEASEGEFVLCVNQDVILDKYFVSAAVRLMEGDERIGAVQGKILATSHEPLATRIIDTAGIVAYKSRRFADRGQGEEDKGQYDKIEEVFGVNGAVAFFRRECLGNVKLLEKEYYDPDFFMYKEDIDLSWRIRLYGWKIVYNPKSVAYVERTSKLISEVGGAAEAINARRKQSQFIKNLSFRNHRLAIIKNDSAALFFRHLPWILAREIGVWMYVLIFEPKTWPAISKLFKQIPRAWKKRKIIIKNKKVGAKEMGKWFG